LGVGQFSPNTDIFTKFYIAKFSPDGRYITDEFLESISCYPNPSVDGDVTLTFDAKLDNNVQIRILTMDGKLIYTTEIFCPANSNTDLPIRLSEGVVAGGIYIIEARTPESIFRKKLLIFSKP
ncbi:MAG: T9SS type A sorting domain-containing protein, partial [Bacteroidota bacterium]|nr:T9SS type A sorting domain-containing protein [Bacteroidota bacterium]